MARHNDNCKRLQEFTKYFNTFKETDSPDSIKNIVTTIHVSASVNIDTAIPVGSNILLDVLTKGVADYHFKSRS